VYKMSRSNYDEHKSRLNCERKTQHVPFTPHPDAFWEELCETETSTFGKSKNFILESNSEVGTGLLMSISRIFVNFFVSTF
jgi:hypothetical protein